MNPRTRLVLGVTLPLLAVVLAVGGYFLFRIGPSNLIGMLLYDQREEGKLQVGDLAPDVPLLSIDGGSVPLHERTGQGKPTVLIFGSYT